MTSNIDRPLVCPILVGRAPYLSSLSEALERAHQGAGETCVVSGEPGVGKSRLVRELRALAATHGVRVLAGRCFEPDRTWPYAPVRDLLADLPGDLVTSTHLRELARNAPELTERLPPRPDTGSDAMRHDERRIVHSWVRFITDLATTRPLLIVIDDVHWADDASLEAVLALAQRIASRPVLLVLTYRSNAVTPHLRYVLAELARNRLGSEIRLPRLTLPEMDAMLRAIFAQPQPIRAEFLHAIDELTEGNPFYIEEVVRALVTSGDIFQQDGRWERRTLAQMRIPISVQDAVIRHSLHLSAAALEVARVAAVAGRSFDFTLLATLTGQAESQLLEIVQELVRAQLVVEESAERFAFRHALTRQAIYASMLARERRALHRAIAETIVRAHGAEVEPYLADLAYHTAEGEAWRDALEFGERAGAQALALYAPHAAVAHFNRAIEAAGRLGVPPPATLLRARGQAQATLGERDGAQADLLQALQRARERGEQLEEVRLLLDLGSLWSGQDYDRSGEYLSGALELAETLALPHLQAECLVHLGGWRLNLEETDLAEECLQRALAIYEQSGDRLGIARTVDMLGTVSDIAGDIAQMRWHYERAADLFRELGDRQSLASTLATLQIAGGAYVFETVALPPRMAAAETTGIAQEALVLSREIGWRAGEAYTVLNFGLQKAARGEYAESLALIHEGLAIAQEIDHREWMTAGEWGIGLILAELLNVSAAHEHLVRARELGEASGSWHWRNLTVAMLAEYQIGLGDLAAAAALLASARDDLPMRTLGQRRVWLARVKLALAAEDAAVALAIVERLDPAAATNGAFTIPLLALLRSDCLVALDRHAEAEAPLRETLRVTAERELFPLLWRSHLAMGKWQAVAGDMGSAHEHYHQARVIVEAMAGSLPEGDLRTEFGATARALIPTARPTGEARGQAFLTPREWEVARLIARGQSNREIAGALFVGERTVETHVTNILRKVAVPSRAGIAAWVERHDSGQART